MKRRKPKPRPKKVAPTNPAPVVEATHVIVRDLDGNVRVQLGCGPDGNPQLRLMAPDGTPRLVAGVCDGVPGLWLFDRQGQPRVELSLDDDGDTAALHLKDAAGVLR